MANFKRKYPLARLRRLRSTKSIRDLVAENKLSTDDLIQPIFVKESLKEMEEIESLKGIYRHSEESILKEIEDLVKTGIKAVAIFPVIDNDKKDEKGTEAINEDNFLNKIYSTTLTDIFKFKTSTCGMKVYLANFQPTPQIFFYYFLYLVMIQNNIFPNYL